MTLEELQQQADKDLKINDAELDLESLKKASETVKAINSNNSNYLSPPINNFQKLYSQSNPVDYTDFSIKINLLPWAFNT